MMDRLRRDIVLRLVLERRLRLAIVVLFLPHDWRLEHKDYR